jgi:translation elongation factor P/translation initiation factor 5A
MSYIKTIFRERNICEKTIGDLKPGSRFKAGSDRLYSVAALQVIRTGKGTACKRRMTEVME